MTKTQAAAIAALRMQMDPKHPGHRATAEVKAHLVALQPWIFAWIEPLINALEPHASSWDQSSALQMGARALQTGNQS